MLLKLSFLCVLVSFTQWSFALPKNKGSFQFALIGDLPYGLKVDEHSPSFDGFQAMINQDPHLKWVLHAGDIKKGSTPCSDAMLMDRFRRFKKFTKPFILTPGDNEWTDCHGVRAGEYQPLERLAKVRKIFFSDASLYGKSFRPEVSLELVENIRWEQAGVLFATIHIVGSENGLKPFDPDSRVIRTRADDREVKSRTASGLQWLHDTFDLAERSAAPGVFLMVHGNPGLEREDAARDGFNDFLKVLQQRVEAFQKPVVLAHGDSHYFRIDKPKLYSRTLRNFTRVETFEKHDAWIRVTVDPQSTQVFSFTQVPVLPYGSDL